MTVTLTDTLAQLSRRFKAAQVERNPKGFHYVSIENTIKRFNEVLGLRYDLTINEVDVTLLEGEETRSGKQQYRADARGHLTVYAPEAASTRAGVGSAVSFDVDMALKSAQAEVMKKAGHQFGVGLQLWDEAERNLVDLVQESLQQTDPSATLASQKRAVQLLAQIEGVTTISAQTIAEHFGITEADLQDGDALTEILTNAGLL